MAPLFQQNPTAQQSTAAPPSRKGGLVFLLVLVVVTTAAAIGAFVWKADLTVRSVTTEGNRIVTKESILKLAAVPMNKRLEDIDLAAIRTRFFRVRSSKTHRCTGIFRTAC
jgi:cell division septal protein FtsQ